MHNSFYIYVLMLMAADLTCIPCCIVVYLPLPSGGVVFFSTLLAL